MAGPFPITSAFGGQLEIFTTVVRKNSIQQFFAQCDIVTSRIAWLRLLSFLLLNVADFKGVQAGYHFGCGLDSIDCCGVSWEPLFR